MWSDAWRVQAECLPTLIGPFFSENKFIDLARRAIFDLARRARLLAAQAYGCRCACLVEA